MDYKNVKYVEKNIHLIKKISDNINILSVFLAYYIKYKNIKPFKNIYHFIIDKLICFKAGLRNLKLHLCFSSSMSY